MLMLVLLVLAVSGIQAFKSLDSIDPRMLSAEFRKSNGILLRATTGVQFSSLIQARLGISYATCLEAWTDMLYWAALLYGDWYGNNGGNTIGYFYWQYIW